MTDNEKILPKRGGQSMLPSYLRNVSKGRVILTTSAFASSMFVDAVAHNGTVAFFGIAGTVIAGLFSGELVHAGSMVKQAFLTPGGDIEQVQITAEKVVEALSPEDEEELFKDQSVKAKLMRLVGMTTPPLEYALDERVVESVAKPKDDRPVVVQALEDDKEDVYEPVFPSYPHDETIVLGKVVKAGQRFDPHFNQISGKGFVACAVQGSGKSQLMGRIIEQGGKCGAPIIVLDHKGEYPPILDLPFIDGIHAGSAEMAGVPKFFELTLKNVDEFVWMVMEERCVAIVNLPSYGGPDDKWLPKAEIVAAVGKSLMRYAIRQRKLDMANGLPPGSTLLPCWLLLDEAQLYLPQQIDLLPPEARENKPLLNELNNSYFTLVSNGRSAGYTVGFATQSLTYIAKWAIKSCQIRIFARHVERNDLDACEKEIDAKVATREEINMLSPGRAVVFGFTLQPMVVQFDKRESKDYSETPGIERLRNPCLTKRSAQPVQRLEPSVSAMGKVEAIRKMREAGFLDSDILALTSISEADYRLILAEIVSASVQRPVRPDEKPAHTTHSDAQPQLNQTQIALFAKGYEMTGNIDKSLKFCQADSRYRQHARVVIAELGLKKKDA